MVGLDQLVTQLRELGPGRVGSRALFDVYAFADYRGGAVDRGGVALAVALGAGPVRVVSGVSSREALARAFAALLRGATGLRVLFGQDHQYGIPLALAEELGLRTGDWRAAMRALFLDGAFAADAMAGQAGRFAAAVNAWLQARGAAPYFWSATKPAYGLPARAPRPPEHPSQRRLTERGVGFALSRVGDNGAVGGQSIVGIPRLLRLLEERDVSAWPFDGLAIGALEGHVAVEPYPRLLREKGVIRGDVNDAVACALWAQRKDREGQLAAALDLTVLPQAHRRRVRFEGWMLGVRP